MKDFGKIINVVLTIFIVILTAFLTPEIIPLVIIFAVVSALINIKKRREKKKSQESGSFEDDSVKSYINDHNEGEVKKMNDKSKRTLAIVLGVICLMTFPFSLPFIFIGVVIYIAKKGRSMSRRSSRHGDERYDHHEDECISCGADFSGEVNEDCMFCGDGSNYDTDDYSSEIYDGAYDKDTSMKDDFDLQTTLSGLGKRAGEFARNTRDSYNSSSWKPRIENATGWLKEELTVRDKDTDEEAVVYSGTYDDKKEEAEGLKVLLRAGIIEKDEYNDRMRELKNRR